MTEYLFPYIKAQEREKKFFSLAMSGIFCGVQANKRQCNVLYYGFDSIVAFILLEISTKRVSKHRARSTYFAPRITNQSKSHVCSVIHSSHHPLAFFHTDLMQTSTWANSARWIFAPGCAETTGSPGEVNSAKLMLLKIFRSLCIMQKKPNSLFLVFCFFT